MSLAKGKFGIVFSKSPVMKAGLAGVMAHNFPEYEVAYCDSKDEMTSLPLGRAVVAIIDISGDYVNPRVTLEQYYLLLRQHRHIHWIFLVPRPLYPLAVELLMSPESTLLSDIEPIEGVLKAVSAGSSQYAERISQCLLTPEPLKVDEAYEPRVVLTLSERKVLRLLGKGWGINQIAMLLKKSNKTVSAQKNSAMRRLSLHGNAEMYAWINSTQGIRELNLISAYGDSEEWIKISQEDILLS
ncbi:DNA-binding response regulator [Enterobacteriaceae bacterium RIT714]|uniref:helix-turn-helix transcriptional regulator n=1 Tax=Lelliottia sp. CFBP8978 TaxID=3096522 RepID=UPI0012AC9736|nr:response regulator transcription factor [Lelliottia sp. CFBP8978]MDY1037127.1 LuxR C-terminal-related transcriptional regulator [Lelliottia sp. CFBP8978]MRS90606.1 DNA-binding response regulator [Enterobacteriaceae bacterium RIT714]